MGLPDGPKTSASRTEQWRVEQVITGRNGDDVTLTIMDRLVRDGTPTDEYRERVLTEAEAKALWRADIKKTYREWTHLIHKKAKPK